MQETTVNVPLLRPDERAPKTGNPVGRLRRIVNGIAAKFRPEDAGLRVEKRNAFTPLETDVFDVESGTLVTLSATDYPSTQLLTVLDDELVAIGGARPLVYSPSRPGWSRFSSHVLTSPPRKSIVYVDSDSVSLVDEAIVGNVACYAYKKAGTTYAKFVDLVTRTTIREPFVVGGDTHLKVCADGVNFFLVYTLSAVATEVFVDTYDAAGALVVSDGAQIVLQDGGNTWDVTALPGTGNGFAFATRSIDVEVFEPEPHTAPAYYPTVYFGTIVDDALTISIIAVPTIPAMPGVAWDTNSVDTAFLRLLTTSTVDSYPDSIVTLPNHGIYAARIKLSDLTVDHTYVVKNDLTALQCRQIGNLTGYATTNTGNMLVSWTTYATDTSTHSPPDGGNYSTNYTTTIFVPYVTAGPVTPVVKRSVSLASRVGLLDGRYVYLAYYASVEGRSINSDVPNQQQPTYFLVDVESQEIVGRFEHGTASADWTHLDWDPDDANGINFFCLPTWAYDAGGHPHLPVGFAADYTTVRTQSDDATWLNTVTPQVGFIDIAFGGAKNPVVFGEELLITGPLPVSFSGDSFECSGIELAPEIPTITGATGAATISYAIVFKTIRPDGSTSHSAVSYIVTRTSNATVYTQAPNTTLVIPTLRTTTHDRVLVEVYRTVWDGAQQLEGFHKITVDVDDFDAFTSTVRHPVWNDPTADTVTFTDDVPHNVASVGAPLYTDDGTLDNHPPPPFSCSAVLGDRVFVGGYDNRVYYSFSKVPGQALAFNEDVLYVTLPTNERATTFVNVDNRLVVFTDRSRYTLDGGQFLDATGEGVNPTPIRLPAAHDGCTGYAVQINEGVLYSGSNDTIRMLDRGLNSVDVSGAVEDELGPFVGVAADDGQRVAFFTASKALVLDQNVGCWYVWELPSAAVAACAHLGELAYAVAVAAPRVLAYDPDSYADNGTAFIQTRAQINSISTGVITGFEVVYECSARGEWLGPHTFNTRASYDGASDAETFSEEFATQLAPYVFNWQPANIECSTIEIEVYDTHDTPTRGFALEGLGLYVGVERGTKYGPRIAPAA